jgi:HK97 gp10 family phage protein
MSNDFERYAKKLQGISPAVKAVQPKAAEAGAKIIRQEVEARAPVGDGDLKGSIGDKAVGRDGNSASHQAHVAIYYALWVERGHGGPHPAPAHPFFRPAYDAKEQEAIDKIVEIQNEALKGAMR